MSKEEKSSLWSQRIREFRSSGQTCKDWCGEHQLPVSTMTYWIRKLKREEESAGDAGPVFANSLPKQRLQCGIQQKILQRSASIFPAASG